MRAVKSIVGFAGAALWMVSGCTATTPSFAPLFSSDPAFRDDDHAAHHQTGLAHLTSGRYGLALFELRKALRQNPRSVETLNAIGIAYDHLGRFDQSLGYYERALALDSGAVQTLNNLGRSAARQGNVASALAWLERAQRLDPDSREVAENLANARAQSAATVASSQQPFPAKTAPAQPIRAWIERTDRLHQTLVTTAPSAILQTLASLDLRPEVVNVAGEQDFSLPNRSDHFGQPRRGAKHHADAPEQTALAPGEDAGSTTPATDRARVEISNGAGRRGMAMRMREHLLKTGTDVGRLTNADHFAYPTSAIFYRPGFEDSAAVFSHVLPVRVDLIEDDRQHSDVRLRLGGDLLDFDSRLLTKG